MSNNDKNFVFDIQTDIKIQSGLKILEFATEYNIAKTYYKNCPFNNYLDHKQKLGEVNKNKIIQKHQQLGLAMSELNEQIMKLGYRKESIEKKKASQLKQQVFMFNVVREQTSKKKKERQSSGIPYAGSDKQIIKEQKNNSDFDVSELTSYKSSKVNSYKAPSIASSNHSKKVRFSPRHQNQMIRNDEKKKQESIANLQQKSKTSKDNSQSAINNASKSINNHSKKSQKLKLTKHQSKKQNSIASKQYLQLNKTYSNILPNSSMKMPTQSQIQNDRTQFELLKQLSDSLVDAQNVKNLIRLQNVQLQEKYLEHRINKRIQKGYHNIQKIRDVTWQSLKMPVINYQMKNFNIAHIID